MLAMQISMVNPYTYTVYIMKITNSVGQLWQDAEHCQHLPRETDTAAMCPLDLLKYCHYTQSKNSFAWSFWYVPIQPNWFFKDVFKVVSPRVQWEPWNSQNKSQRSEISQTRSTDLSFMRVQIPCDSRSTFWGSEFLFSGSKEQELDLTPCYSDLGFWYSTQRIQTWNRTHLVSLSLFTTGKDRTDFLMCPEKGQRGPRSWIHTMPISPPLSHYHMTDARYFKSIPNMFCFHKPLLSRKIQLHTGYDTEN